MKQLITKIFSTILIVLTLIMLALPVSSVKAATGPAVSLTFDDGFESTYTSALPILSSRNLPATVYVTSGYIDSGVTDDADLPAMTWSQVQALQNTYGWEIGGHTQTHPELPTLTNAQVIAQIANSNDAFMAHGLEVKNFASPFGAYDNAVLVELLKSYQSHRGFADIAYNQPYPVNRGVLQVQQVNSDTTLAQVKGYIDTAAANGTWLILVFHHVAPTLDPNYEYTTTEADLEQIGDYLISKGVSVQTVETMLEKQGQNVVANYNFADGFTNWSTDRTAQVTHDVANHGAYSDSENAAKIVGGATAAHLFSSMINAVPGVNYTFEAFYNTVNLTAGELGFYIDEYDAAGNWVSGKWLGKVANNALGYFNSVFSTTSTLVNKFSVQTYLTANATGTAYIDNVEVHDPTLAGSPTPTISGTPSVTPTPTVPANPGNSVIANGSFENAVSGWAANWTRNSTTAYTLDTTSKGNDGANAIKVVTSAAAAHMFSDLFSIAQDTYTWSQYVTTSNLTGEFGFYIDEYDAAGNWISGQWKGLVDGAFTGVKQFTYIPSSVNVVKASLQYYLIGGTNTELYVDSVSLTGSSQVSGTPSPTPSGSVSPTETPSVTPSVSPTGTPFVTPTVSPTGTPSVTLTPTPGPSGNIVQNGSFETLVSGFPTNWTTNDVAVYSVNTASQGDNGVNSVHVVSSATARHLFSDKIAVEQSTYSWKSYIKATTLAGEFGFYIDEYDVNGNWVSGQWKGAIYGPFTQIATFAYTPTAANVAQIGLQYYLVGGSTADLYLDSVSLSK